MIGVRASRGVVLAALTLAFAGCVSVSTQPTGSAQEAPSHGGRREPGRYVAVDQPWAQDVAGLRAAPPPALAEVTQGTSLRADEHALAARSLVRIGTGCYRSDDDAARDWALRNGTRVGADKILLYTAPTEAKAGGDFAADVAAACQEDAKDALAEWPFVATFYVRYKLPFGAQFRSMSTKELKDAGAEGGVQLGAVVNGTPAAEANLRSGDFIVKFNGATVRNREAFGELLRANMGRKVTLTVSRNGDTFDRIVRLGVAAVAP